MFKRISSRPTPTFEPKGDEVEREHEAERAIMCGMDLMFGKAPELVWPTPTEAPSSVQAAASALCRSGLSAGVRIASDYAEGASSMMSWKTYLWASSISAGLMLCAAGFTLWVYLFRASSANGWIVLAQVGPLVAYPAIFALTYRRNRSRMEQARADAVPPKWHPLSPKLDW